MEPESLLNLIDSYWFEHQILKNKADPQNSEQNPPHKTPEVSHPNTPAISTRSMDELVSSSSNGSCISSFSPNSVLHSRPLRPIFSGKELKESLSEQEGEEEQEQELELEVSRTGKKAVKTERPRRNSGTSQRKKSRKLKRGASKSLSDLEFDEIKGFMELGFVFSEQDKSSEFLATILPGLQRLGVEEEAEKEGSAIPRPYLSEAWVRKRESPPLMMSWEELRSVNSKIDMKDYLKGWAHNVASSVK